MSENKPWIVQKFGGSALREIESCQAIASIVNDYADRYRIAVVTSALYGVTDTLETLITKALMSQLCDQVADKLLGARLLGHCPDTTRAEILVTGELLSSALLNRFFIEQQVQNKTGLTSKLCPSHVIKACFNNEQAHSLNATFDIDGTRKALADKQNADILVVPGFVACDEGESTVTLGRNGSDYTAAGIAAALDAERCQIWKDVDGIYTADPRIVSNSQVLDEVSYSEAMELSYFGAKVINAKALLPLTQHNIPCEIRNFLAPEKAGTLVHSKPMLAVPTIVKGVTHLEGISSVTLSGMGLRGMIGFARRVSETLARQGISIILIVQSSSEYSLTLCIASDVAEKAKRALEEEFYFELQQHLVNPVQLKHQRAVVSLVGEGMQHQRGIAARFLQAVASARVNIEIIAQGSTESAIALVVEREVAPIAVKAVHSAFFSEYMPLDVILLGCGNVGSELLNQIKRQQVSLSTQHIGLKVRGIANSRQLLHDPDGIDLENWQDRLASEGQAYTRENIVELRQQYGLLNPVIVDCSTNEELAREYADYLLAGFHVVTANKKANTLEQSYYNELRKAAQKNFRKFLYETNVGAGLPVLDTLQSLLRSGDEMQGFQGILSGSLSLIMGLLQDGMSFRAACKSSV